jgi:CRP/FNR family transcriptional regulator, cyclic AMP receptor protein
MLPVQLIEVDADLGRYLEGGRLAAARRELVAEVVRVKRGPADLDEYVPGGHSSVGLLVVDGLIERDVLVADTISAELLGPGDVIRSPAEEDVPLLLGVTVKWDVLADSRFAVLDQRVGQTLQRYPEVNAVVLDRLHERVHRLATAQAISQLNGVDRRLLALFWHLSERWGRVASDGLLVPLDLPHRVLAQLVGARRPTVSTAMRRLAERGEVRRRPDGAWIVDRSTAAQWAPRTARAVAPRRLRLVSPANAGGDLELPVADRRYAQLRPSVTAVERKALQGMRMLRQLLDQSAELQRVHGKQLRRFEANRKASGARRQPDDGVNGRAPVG